MQIKHLSAAFFALATLVSGQAFAGSASNELTVTASVAEACSVSSALLSFGAYNPASGSPVIASSSIDVVCTLGTAASIALDPGMNSGESSLSDPDRHMSNGQHLLAYELFQDSELSTIWAAEGAARSFTGSGAPQSLPIYGMIPAGQQVSAGAYSDSVLVSVNF
jgi:spore coat protein U-like protein